VRLGKNGIVIGVVPFNRPLVARNQLRYVNECFLSGKLSGDGEFTKRVSAAIREIHNGSDALLTTSCTDALEMCALLLDIKEGDEVIVPSFTFVSSANAFFLLGARIVLVDIDPNTLCISAESINKAISPKTRAIVCVNYAGVPSVTNEIASLANEHGIVIIEDNAHGLFGSTNDRPLGLDSTFSTLSFHETKNVTCGEGGALIINENKYLERAEIIREKGTNRKLFFKNLVDKYSWCDKGSSYLMSDINAAVLLAQLEERAEIQQRRQFAYEFYSNSLNEWANKVGVTLPIDREDSQSSFHLFHMILPNEQLRNDLLAYLNGCGIKAVFHYIPLHQSIVRSKYSIKVIDDCMNSENIASRLIRLPLFSSIETSEVEKVVNSVLNWFPNR
jgi:dTDP-4-amino-4,6-dideoxygalactose transaminase